MTLDELAFKCHVSAATLDRWADLGALGPQFQERRVNGRWRHITKDVARRAILLSRIVETGVSLEVAMHAVGRIKEFEPGAHDRVIILPFGATLTLICVDLP